MERIGVNSGARTRTSILARSFATITTYSQAESGALETRSQTFLLSSWYRGISKSRPPGFQAGALASELRHRVGGWASPLRLYPPLEPASNLAEVHTHYASVINGDLNAGVVSTRRWVDTPNGGPGTRYRTLPCRSYQEQSPNLSATRKWRS